ncbi:hypothetical protein ACFQ6C_26175 [Streptomyces sp. NPDC056454]|uniref:hypothetical protein n=1 Tax=Streptomyces sp. NPDC056454 TaxID=3345823 RepID=UPI0036CF1F9A
MRPASSASTYGIGWTIKQVDIREIDWERGRAYGVDTEGQRVEIATSVRRTGITPEVGQTWMVDRTYGPYTLAALISHEPPS